MVALATLLTPLPTLRPETGLERGRLRGGGRSWAGEGEAPGGGGSSLEGHFAGQNSKLLRTRAPLPESQLIPIEVPGCNCPENSRVTAAGKFFLLFHPHPFKGEKDAFGARSERLSPAADPCRPQDLVTLHLARVLRWTSCSPRDA